MIRMYIEFIIICKKQIVRFGLRPRDSFCFTRRITWQYHKYTFVQNESDGIVNGSRLWNSIKKAENIKIKTSLKAFLESKQIQEKKDAFIKLFSGQVMYTDNYKNINQPQFNGIQIHPAIVHYVVDKLDAEYGFMVSIMAFKKFIKPIPTSKYKNIINKLNDSEDQ